MACDRTPPISGSVVIWPSLLLCLIALSFPLMRILVITARASRIFQDNLPVSTSLIISSVFLPHKVTFPGSGIRTRISLRIILQSGMIGRSGREVGAKRNPIFFWPNLVLVDTGK